MVTINLLWEVGNSVNGLLNRSSSTYSAITLNYRKDFGKIYSEITTAVSIKWNY